MSTQAKEIATSITTSTNPTVLQKKYHDDIKKDTAKIVWDSFILIFSLVLIGILAANVVYFGSYVDSVPVTANNYTGYIPINKSTAKTMKITNGVLLVIPLIMAIYAIVSLAMNVEGRKHIQEGLKLAAAPKQA